MANTVVIFGMAHSGKTTCAGYIYNQSMQGKGDYDFEGYVDSVKKELGEKYDASRDFGYLLDKSKDERIRRKKSGIGESKELHIKSIQFSDSKFVIIDTPGAQHKATQRQKGMYYGDIGVFCVEINKIIDDRYLENQKYFLTFMSTLILWTKFNKKTIIALTKMDAVDFKQEKYEYACGILKQLCQDIDVSEIIPISIDVKGRIGKNIFESSNDMPWYNGKDLVSAISEEIRSNEQEKNERELLFYVDRNYAQSHEHTGKCWRIKVIRGVLQKGQKICLSPVLINKEFCTVTATIKSIRSDLDRIEGVQYIDCAAEGDFVGIDLTDIVHNKRRVDKRNLDTVCTTCGFSTKFSFSFSDKFVFRVGVQYIEKLGINRQMDLLWFGRAITFEIISKNIKAEGIEVHARVMNKYLCMPLDRNNRYLIEYFIVKYDHNLNADPFMEVKLLSIGGEE
ncbi:MAG: hypothetical protein HFJ01_04615 [Lachnospiraceae bacterium]|jgi:translation elongation factor EF-1alpha|nr:hypothetical protein [Lachnospiraceae bacterium]